MSGFDIKTLTVSRDASLHRPRYRVELLDGAAAGHTHDFEGTLRIGGRDLADLVILDPKVSGLHCELVAGNDLRVRDLGSKNGTFLSGIRVYDAVVPQRGELTVGASRLRISPLGELAVVPLHDEPSFHGVYGRSAVMRALTARLERLSVVDTTVLIQGETGVGKERIADALHRGGPRRSHPLVVVDCGALPPNLIESEFFGHERGAFTGAVARTTGAFERAHGGTIFLDEIGELPLDLQPKLLRVLESRKVRRVGGDRSIDIDVRVVAASNRDLALEASRGRFREDLYYRLAVVKLNVPPLRERLEDVPLLAYHLLRESGIDPLSVLSESLLASLADHAWPGNVRELRNALERYTATGEVVTPERPSTSGHAAPAIVASGEPAPATASMNLAEPLRLAKQRLIETYERAYVSAQLEACGGNVSECARRSGMDRMSIHRIIQRLGLRTEDA